MYWLTENAFQPLMFGLLLAFASWAAWFMLKKRLYLVGMILALAATLGIVITEQLIVTDKEQLTKDIYDTAGAVSANDQQRLLSFISPKSQGLIDEINREMPNIDFESVRIGNLAEPIVDLDSVPPTATLEFNARVSANAVRSSWGVKGTGLSRVTLKYEKDSNGDWKILSYSNSRIRPADFF